WLSITSKCTQSAPAASTLSTSSPSRAKSAERMEGAMTVGCMVGSGWTRGRRTPRRTRRRAVQARRGVALAPAAGLADAVVGAVDLGGALLRLVEQLGRRARHAVGMVLRHQPPVGQVELGVAGLALQPQHRVRVVARDPEPVA